MHRGTHQIHHSTVLSSRQAVADALAKTKVTKAVVEAEEATAKERGDVAAARARDASVAPSVASSAVSDQTVRHVSILTGKLAGNVANPTAKHLACPLCLLRRQRQNGAPHQQSDGQTGGKCGEHHCDPFVRCVWHALCACFAMKDSMTCC